MALGVFLSSVVFLGGMALSLIARQRWIEGEGPSIAPRGSVLGLCWLIPALVPGIALGLLAYRMPRYLRVACPKCGWRERYRIGATGATPTGTAILPMHRHSPPCEDDASRRIEQMESGPPLPVDSPDGPDAESLAWAYAEIANGKSPESVAEELVQNGWDQNDAEDLAERARKQTRHLRP